MTYNFDILNALPHGTFCIDHDYSIVFWNSIMEDWTGLKKERVEDQTILLFFPQLKKKLYQMRIDQVFEQGTSAFFSYQLHKTLFPINLDNGERLCIRSHVTRIENPDHTGKFIAVFSLQDIGGLIHQIKQTKDVKDQLVDLLKKMQVTENELRVTNEELQRAANTDPLTGLSNRRSMMFLLENEVERHKRYGTKFSILLSDIDNFKSFNDKYGHACGDSILSELGKLFYRSVRPIDSVCRWGGEEFLFLLPETDPEEAVLMAERIRNIIEAFPFSFKGINHNVTMTFGVSSYEDHLSLVSMINNADSALYNGKNCGKNRVVLYPELVN